MPLDKLTAYGTIVCAVCAPLALFFTAAVFFQWKPETFFNLGIMSIPVGTAIIVLLLGVFPWLLVIGAYRRAAKISTGPQDKTKSSSILGTVETSLGDFTIDYAGYGLGPSQYHNVTDRVKSLVKDGKLQIVVGPEDLECEVYSGKPGKHLLVIYSHGKSEGLCKKTDVYQRMILP